LPAHGDADPPSEPDAAKHHPVADAGTRAGQHRCDRGSSQEGRRLAFNLLRLINSASFGAHRKITSFKQAVMLLGLNKLFRWAAMLLTAAREGGPPPAVGQTAVIRGRLMELLAKHSLTDTDADLAFICGMFSMLDRMLGMPLPAALALIPVSESVSAALLHHEGILGELLILTKACESHDQEQFDRSACSLELSTGTSITLICRL
jgi:EAL and modified HD-GYP domain-containing signal transduction protein